MADSFILPMDTTDDALELIGGKGRSLAKMSNAGLNVPSGFHLTADAYRAFAVPAVPEPSTWLQMILGFGALAGSMRFRKRGLKGVRFA